MNEQLLRRQAVEQATGLPRSTIYRLMAASPPEFPKPVRLGNGTRSARVGWVKSEVDAWIAARIAARDGKAA